MRRSLTTLVLLAALAAGCVGLGDTSLTVQEPDLPEGLLVTYETTQDEEDATSTFLVQDEADGYQLLPYNATPGFESPFLALDASLEPHGQAWEDILRFPLTSGDEYEATLAGQPATVTIETTTFRLDGDEHDALKATATGENDALATLTLLPEPTVLAHIDITREDGVHETWRLTNATHHPTWNEAATWEKGDWWRYNATTRGETVDTTLIYNQDKRSPTSSPQRILNPQHAEARIAATPFNVLRSYDLAPQAGMVNDVLSTFWDWPLEEGKLYSGSGSITGPYMVQVSLEEIILPNGQASTAFVLNATDHDDPDTDPFASWTYAPHTGFLTEFWVQSPDEDAPRFDWELTDWGTGFHGDIEVPHLETVHAIDQTSGPVDRTDTFTVNDQGDRLRVSGWFVHSETPPRLNVTLEDPSGETRWGTDEGAFEDQFFQVEEVVRPVTPGEWTLTLDAGEGINFFLDVEEVWIETRQVDYR